MFDDFELDLPDELQGGRTRTPEPQSQEVSRQELLNNLGAMLGDLRDKAVKGRAESGIEAVWKACEEAYQGIDDANRAEFSGAKWIKPTTPAGPVTTAREGEDEGKSTAFVMLTARYVDMAAAKIQEIALPIDDMPFSMDPTPVPELVNQLGDTTPVVDANGQPVMLPEQPAAEPGQAPTPAKPKTAADVAQEQIDAAAESAEKASKRIWDWLAECNYPAEMRTLLHDAARLGVGVLKGPFPDSKTTKALSKAKTEGGFKLKLTIVEKTTNAVKWVDPWNFFPDPACGEDINTGNHVFERDFISRTVLKGLKRIKDSMGQPIYMADQIDKVLSEGPEKCNLDGASPTKVVNKDQFTIWYFTGTLSREDMAAANAVGVDELPEEIDDVFALCTVVNDTVIRSTINPLESGGYAYRVLPWSRRAGSWAGVGVGEKVSLAQRVTNASTRALLNNAGVTSGSQIIIDPIGLIPANGSNRITPLKVWHKTPEATAQDLRSLFMAVDIPNQVNNLMSIINYGMKLAEEASSIPLISQGQIGETSPQTFGQAELMNNNANAYLRSLGMGIDDKIIDPLINDCYELLLLDPEVPDDEKGDFQIVANGTIAMVERAIQEQTMLQAANLVQNAAFGIDPKKWFSEYWKTKRLDPRKIQYTADELAKMAQQPQPEAPVITAAKIRSQSAEKIAASRDQVGLQKVKADTDRDTVYVQAEQQRAQSAAELAQGKLELEREIAHLNYQIKLMDYAHAEKISLQEARTKLADTAMRLNVQQQLSADDRQHDLHKHRNPQPIQPPTEPAGRAPNGEAFEA